MADPSGTVTFLFTDIEGSTRLWQLDEAAMRSAVACHDILLRAVIADHRGTVFSGTGDGVAAAFGSAASAVKAALAAQARLAGQAWPTAEPVRVRMGLHTGEAESRDGDYFGTTVNRAARVMAVGRGGQVLCSSATASLVESDALLVDLGQHRLRDLDRPVHLFQVGEGSFAPPRSLASFPGNLPVQLTSFVGVHVQVGYWLFLAPRSSRASASVVALASRGPTPTVWAPVTSGSNGPGAAPSLPAIPSPPGGLTGIQKHRLLASAGLLAGL